jgi:hypothetical protein
MKMKNGQNLLIVRLTIYDSDYFGLAALNGKRSQDPNLFSDLQKNEILRRSSHKIVVKSHSSENPHTLPSEDFLKILERKDLRTSL